MEKLPEKERISLNPEASARLDSLEKMVKVMDGLFHVPGTRLRFGMDALVGLIPWVGDTVTFLFSGAMVVIMSRYGVSGMVVLKMVGNILVDYLIGSIPFLGDIFDFSFRANRRNFNLLREHYDEGRHQGSAWWVLSLIAALILGLIVGAIWLASRLISWFLPAF